MVTVPGPSAKIATSESMQFLCSWPVATMGASGRSRGTAWRCMLAPIRARLASSFWRKGIMAVATDTIILGDTST